MRPPCYDCVRKHLGQALVLLCEAEKGYPSHGWLAVGHMGEAEDEALRLDKSLTEAIRSERLLYMSYLNSESETYSGDLLELIQMVTDLRKVDTSHATSDSSVS
jgi:hypothetical protein